MLLRRAKLIHPEAHKGINTWIIYFALPAVSFKYLPKIEWTTEMLFPILSSILVWAGSWLFMELYCKSKGYKQRSRSTLELASGYSNTSFIGFPLVTAFFGKEFLPIAIICDQATFVLLSTVGIINALKGKSGEDSRLDVRYLLKKLVTFPPFIGCISALLLSSFISFEAMDPFFDHLVATMAPLALFSIGLQLKFKGWKKQIGQVGMAVFYKLLIAPLLVLIAVLLLKIDKDIAKVTILEAAMPTLVTAGIVADQYGLNTKLINLVIGLSILIGLFTVFIWDQIITWLVL